MIALYDSLQPPHWATLNSQTVTSDPKFNLVNGGDTVSIANGSIVDFEAKLMANNYLSSSERLTYFQHQLYQETHNGQTFPTLYERYETDLSYFSDFLTVYKPIQKTENLVIPWIVTFTGTQSLMNIVQDISILRSYYTNDWLSTRTYTTTNQLDLLISILQPVFEASQRRVHFISHSLGSYLSNYCAYKLVSSSSLIRLHGLSQSMFAPYLLVDEAYQYFRDVDISEYNVKVDLRIFTIEGDWITGLVSTYGIGTVTRYTLTVAPLSPDVPVLVQDDGIVSWFNQVLDFPAGSSLEIITDNFKSHYTAHKIIAFFPAGTL